MAPDSKVLTLVLATVEDKAERTEVEYPAVGQRSRLRITAHLHCQLRGLSPAAQKRTRQGTA